MEKLHFNNISWRWQSSGVACPSHLFELQHSAQSLHHGVLLVMLHQICQRVKLLPSTNVIFEILKRQMLLQINALPTTTATAPLGCALHQK